MQLEEFLDHGNLVIMHYLLLSLTHSECQLFVPCAKAALGASGVFCSIAGPVILNRAFCPQRQQLLWLWILSYFPQDFSVVEGGLWVWVLGDLVWLMQKPKHGEALSQASALTMLSLSRKYQGPYPRVLNGPCVALQAQSWSSSSPFTA